MTTTHKTDAERSQAMRLKICYMARMMGWLTPEGGTDMQAIHTWCMAHSYLKKPLALYEYRELPKLVSQFSQMKIYYFTKKA